MHRDLCKPWLGLLLALCTHHRSDIACLIVLISSSAIRQISPFIATWVSSMYDSGGLWVELKKLLANPTEPMGTVWQNQTVLVGCCPQKFRISIRSGGLLPHDRLGRRQLHGLCVGRRLCVCVGLPPHSPQMVRSHDCTVKIELV